MKVFDFKKINKMKNIAISSAVAALISSSSAIKVTAGPDVFGPNGTNYQNGSATYDLSRIGIDITTQGTGHQCAIGDWTTFSYQAYLKDGRMVADTTDQNDGRDTVISLGASETFKCFELALPQLKQGDAAKIHCPYDLAYGNAFTWPDVGGEPVPLHSDIDFDIIVKECNKVPERTTYFTQPVTTTMQPGVCMYLHLVAEDDVMHKLVLSAVDNGATPLNVLVEEQVFDDKSQQFFYDPSDASLYNAAHPDLRLSELPGGEVGLVPLTSSPTKWYYDPKTSGLTAGELSLTEVIYATRAHDMATVKYGLQSSFGGLNTAKFRIEYCKQYFGS